MPGKLGTVIPHKDSISLNNSIDIFQSPDFEYRLLYACDFPKDEEGALWYRRAGFGAPFPLQVNHSFHLLKIYKEKHPGIFALKNGKRDFSQSCMGAGNLCLSNPETAELFVKYIIDFFKKHPKKEVFPVVPNDGLIEICECKNCQSQIRKDKDNTGKFSDYVWKFVNSVAKKLAEKMPDKKIACLAYSAYTKPPDFDLNPNVLVMLCKRRRKYFDSGYKNSTEKLIKDWRNKINNDNLYFWEYYNWHITPYLRNIPVFFPGFISDEIKALKGKSKGEFVEAETWYLYQRGKEKMHYPGLTHLNYYITARLFWDSELSKNKLMKDYCEKFYGPACEVMLKFWNTCEKLWSEKKSTDAEYLYKEVYNENNVSRLIGYLDQGLALTLKDSLYHQRIKMIYDEMLPLKKRLLNSRVVSVPQYKCNFVEKGPLLDGVLNDPCWEKAEAVDFVKKNGGIAKYSSVMKIIRTKDFLCFGIKNYDAQTGKLVTKASNDSCLPPYIWKDDSIEIFFNPFENNDSYYKQFIINAAGKIWDAEFRKGYSLNRAVRWKSNIKAVTAVTPEAWTVEIKIPLNDIAKKTSPDFVKMNVIRNRNCKAEITISCWSPTLTGNNQNQSRFGKLFLNSQSKDSASKKHISRFDQAYNIFRNCRVGSSKPERSYVNAANEFLKLKNSKGLYFAILCYMLEGKYVKAEKLSEKLSRKLPQIKHLFKRNGSLNRTKYKTVKKESSIFKLLVRLLKHKKYLFELQKKITSSDYKAVRISKGKYLDRYLAVAYVLIKLKDNYVTNNKEFLEHIKQAVCISNLKIIGAKFYLYAQKHNNCMPLIRQGKSLWSVQLLKNESMQWHSRPDFWICPIRERKDYSYGMNVYVSYKYKGNLNDIPGKHKVILLADSIHYAPGNYPHKPDPGGAAFQICGPYEHGGIGTPNRNAHLGGVNILFADGHVEWLEANEIPISGSTDRWMGKK